MIGGAGIGAGAVAFFALAARRVAATGVFDTGVAAGAVFDKMIEISINTETEE